MNYSYLTTVILVVASHLLSFGQGVWTQRADVGGTARWEAIGFATETKGYMALGNNSNNVYEYDIATDTWTQKSILPGGNMTETISFVVNDKAYIAGGVGEGGQYFWEYDPAADTWTADSLVIPWLQDHSAFSIGDKGYICNGWDGNQCRKELWEYDYTDNSWTQKADFPAFRVAAVAFSIGGFAFVGTGVGYEPYETGTKEFWRYEQATDTWTSIADFGGIGRREAVAFTIGTKGYVGTGGTNEGGTQIFKDFWEYDPSTDTWTQVADLPGAARGTAGAFSLGGKGFVGLGSPYPDFWEFDPRASPPNGVDDPLLLQTGAYPNPSNGMVQLLLPANVGIIDLRVFNLHGQQVMHHTAISGNLIEIHKSDLGAGVYFYQLHTGNGMYDSGKFVFIDQ
jgi:hypothetical protein